MAVFLGLASNASIANAADGVPGTLSDVRVGDEQVNATLVLRSTNDLAIDAATVRVTLGGKDAKTKVAPATAQPRSTILVIDTSGSMGASGMATVRAAVKDFLNTVPKDVKVGVVSFASTAGVDVAPTTDHARVSREVASLRSKGETALYDAIQIAVKALGTKGERSIVLLSDGGDTVAQLQGGDAGEKQELAAALAALKKAKVRAEVVAFKSAESNSGVLKQFASAGGGSVANATDSDAVSGAFEAAARTLVSQSALSVAIPAGVSGVAPLLVTGNASGKPFTVSTSVDLGDTAPVVTPTTGPTLVASATPEGAVTLSAVDPKLLYPAVGLLMLGIFVLAVVLMGTSFKSRRTTRVEAIEVYGFGRSLTRENRAVVNTSALSEQLVQIGDRVMEGRESTTKTMALLERADLPWRAGEWFLLRIVAVIVSSALGYLLLMNRVGWLGLLGGALAGLLLPSAVLRFLARRRSRAFEASLPDVLMLVATSLASGFSLLQALDAVAKDAAEPCAKEFSRALAETRIGADVSDALEHTAIRMDSENMRWTTMAIRIQREVGGNLAETLRTTAATLREREMLRRQVRALSAEGRLSAWILIALPVGMFFYMLWVNYEYVSLLWTTLIGILMLVGAGIGLIIGVFWLRKVVEIEV